MNLKVGDILIQVHYNWGKDSNGDYIKYRVVELNDDYQVSCIEISTNKFSHYIPENTWIKVEDYRNSKIKKILS